MFCFGMLENFKETLIEKKNEVIKEIMIVIWSDLIAYYNFLSKEVRSDKYFRIGVVYLRVL